MSLNNDIGLLEETIEKLNPQQKETQELSAICKRMKEEVHELSEVKKRAFMVRYEVTADICMENFRVLLIDNDIQMNGHTTKLLEGYSVKTDVAMTVEEAIQYYEQEQYDMVLLSALVEPIRCVQRIRKLGEPQLIVGLLRTPESALRKELQENGVEIMLYTPIQPPLIEAIFQRDFYDKIKK